MDEDDHTVFATCMAGASVACGTGCGAADLDADGDVDPADAARFQIVFTAHDGRQAVTP